MPSSFCSRQPCGATPNPAISCGPPPWKSPQLTLSRYSLAFQGKLDLKSTESMSRSLVFKAGIFVCHCCWVF